MAHISYIGHGRKGSVQCQGSRPLEGRHCVIVIASWTGQRPMDGLSSFSARAGRQTGSKSTRKSHPAASQLTRKADGQAGSQPGESKYLAVLMQTVTMQLGCAGWPGDRLELGRCSSIPRSRQVRLFHGSILYIICYVHY